MIVSLYLFSHTRHQGTKFNFQFSIVNFQLPVSWGLGGYLNSYDLSIIDHQERDVSVFAVCYLFLHFYGSREQKSPPYKDTAGIDY